MRVIYADPGLSVIGTHHYTICRNLIKVLDDRGIEIVVVASANARRHLIEEFNALPLLQMSPYFLTDGEPICGWLNAFMMGANLAHSDFARIPDLRHDDILYVASGQPAHTLGLANWLASRAPENRPSTVMELIYSPGLDPVMRNGNEEWASRDPRVDARGAFYRFTGLQLRALNLPQLHFVTAHHRVVDIFSTLLERRVSFIPSLPFKAEKPPRNRVGHRPIVVAVIGYQWSGKGYMLIPDVIDRMLKNQEGVRIIAHDSVRMESTSKTQELLRGMAGRDDRLILREGPIDYEGWLELLDSIDLLLCPYDPAAYRVTGSGLVQEALANGIPLVVPGDTVLASQVEEFGGGGSAFIGFDAESIYDAVDTVVRQFDAYAEKAFVASKKWSETQGPDKYMDGVLKAASGG